MRLSSTAMLAMPLLASAQLEQYQAKFQHFIDNFGSYIPNPNHHDPVEAAEAKLGAMKLDTITVNNWRDTLYAPVREGATEPEEWWISITGGNKTCMGRCDRFDTAFNETAAQLALQPSAPHVAVLNCDHQPVLCNAWGAGPGSIWQVDVLPDTKLNEVYSRRFNLTTVTTDEMASLAALEPAERGFTRQEGVFHPFKGFLAENGLNVPVGYLIWGMNVVPSWAMMITISFISRTMMSRNQPGGAPHQRTGASEAERLRAGARPGDGR